ncbi:putative glyoxal oxidase [Xylariomycetidae sp. FL0641]|nr:putative glyoxal oxidase [Xylariomycetidae sp. FL0641]
MRTAGVGATWSLLLLSAIPLTVSKALVVPSAAELDGMWNYMGCYTEVPGRALNQASFVQNNMTIESCLAFCDGQQYAYAGLEYSSECYCGAQLPNNSMHVNGSTDCTMPCSGNTQEVCGGPNRLTVFFDPYVVGPQPNTGLANWTHIGCYQEGLGGRALTYGAPVPAGQMTAAKCTSACQQAGFVLAGTEYGGECYCGNTLQNNSTTALSGCSFRCNGNSSEVCGGSNRLNVYDFNMQYQPSSSSTQPGSSSTGSSSTTAVASTTASTTSSFTTSTTSAASSTTASASSSFTTSATTATTSTSTTSSPTSSSTSSSVSSTSSSVSSTSSPVSSISSSVATTGSTTAPVTSSSTAASAPSTTASNTPGFPNGWVAQGCWHDGPNGRVLPWQQEPEDNTMTQQKCAQLCFSQGYNVSGTEYYDQCFCGNAMYNGGAPAQDQTQCNTPCDGDHTQMCGGPNYLTVWSLGTPVTYQVPRTQTDGLNGTWTYQGCWSDNVNNVRTLPWQLFFDDTNSAWTCLSACAAYGYSAAGMEYGEECFCGDPINIEQSDTTLRPESECNQVCSGDPAHVCGSGSRLSMYYYTGSPPLYQFDYPEGNDQGTYSMLIGGVDVPLMTTQGINGKVMFLSKWGTGYPNSTGAYQLDLSQVNNFTGAWQALHVKTDMFCSAGIILPDKAGRQLTVAGWSLGSTYGIRLYAPDGSPGVNGTNDWQENLDLLSLQKGRWYPGAMLLANGSVAVVGGEIGSNDKPEPTIEILPQVGPPVYMDWLNKTDPYNLFPFLTNLPSGNVLAVYYNQARILDAKTFQTISVLPQIPTAVNNPAGGRTYPLEGTAVLLPQMAPYTDPLGVLVCGGSTPGGEALDNCATIYPEAANPTWVLERMPSKRVLTCMAPLPDGTYLINNGAMEGYAGFGLADIPNYSALLYDPKQPLNQRISVMANTTIARMYHSETITLLDGRLLVTGSDPEDGVHPEEMRVEVFTPPYLLSDKPRPSFTVADTDWSYGEQVAFTLGAPPPAGAAIQVSLLGAVFSTHGNSMGARTLFPAVQCAAGSGGVQCFVTAPPNGHVCPAGWYQMFVLQDGIPAVGVYVRIGGDPGQIGNWPQLPGFTPPGV